MNSVDAKVLEYRVVIERERHDPSDPSPKYSLLVCLYDNQDIYCTATSNMSETAISAELACVLGTGPAAALLHEYHVPRNSRLWDLNHTGYIPMKPEEVAHYVRRLK